jgi:hypothetical protein
MMASCADSQADLRPSVDSDKFQAILAAFAVGIAMTITAQSIIHRATDLLQDQTSVRWPANELVRWLNDAQRAVIKVRPDSMNTTTAFRCSEGSRQTLKSSTATAGTSALAPAPAKLIEITRNLAATSAKKAVREVARGIMDAQTPGWHNLPATVDIQHFMFDPRDPLTFYTYPPATSAAELELMYAAYPTDITEPAEGTTYTAVIGSLSLPDIYADDVLNLILYRAYSKDSEYAGNAERASGYMQMVTASLGAEIAATMAVKPQMKPGMTA